MEIKFLAHGSAENVLVELTEECQQMEWAIAWARPSSKVLDAAFKHASKFQRLIIGTHFHQTDPAVLRRFARHAKARMVLPRGDTFHPKAYVFRIGSDLVAVVGSHNLTPTAFTGNSELSLLLRAPAADPMFTQLLGFMKDEWSNAVNIEENIDAYEIQHKLKKRHVEALQAFSKFVRKPSRNSTHPSPYELSWSQYVREVKADRHGISQRLAVLESARKLFMENESLSRMSRQERNAIAGCLRKEFDGQPWGWFGTMYGNGDFGSLVNDGARLSDALDEIPLTGVVEESHFDAYRKLFKRAFKNATHVGDYPTATRLAAMKRPDRFVCVNSANRKPLCLALGVAYSSLSLENYWERIVVPLEMCAWWSQPAPFSGIERAIWDGRMALLDCLYYDGDA